MESEFGGSFQGKKTTTYDSHDEFYASKSNQAGDAEDQNDNNNNQEEHEYISDDL